MENTKTMGFNFWRRWLERRYAKRMYYYKQLAEYNLHRHNDAVDTYERKKSYRNNSTKGEPHGFYIADENADLYASQYNENWARHIEYKHKLEALRYQLEENEEPKSEEDGEPK